MTAHILVRLGLAVLDLLIVRLTDRREAVLQFRLLDNRDVRLVELLHNQIHAKKVSDWQGIVANEVGYVRQCTPSSRHPSPCPMTPRGHRASR